MLDKYMNINTNEYKASVKQVGGILQINDVTVTAKTRKQLKHRLKNTLTDVIDVLSDLNKLIDEDASKTTKNTLGRPPKNQVKQLV